MVLYALESLLIALLMVALIINGQITEQTMGFKGCDYFTGCIRVFSRWVQVVDADEPFSAAFFAIEVAGQCRDQRPHMQGAGWRWGKAPEVLHLQVNSNS